MASIVSWIQLSFIIFAVCIHYSIYTNHNSPARTLDAEQMRGKNSPAMAAKPIAFVSYDKAFREN
jgi:hypothetical protein